MGLSFYSDVWKHVHDRIISLIEDAWAYKSNLISPGFNEVPVPSQNSERPYIDVLDVLVLPLVRTVFRLDFGTVPSHWYFFFFHFNKN